jgi:hypothetical protein
MDYSLHYKILKTRDKASADRKLVEYLPYHTAARCGGGKRECDSNLNNNLNLNGVGSNKQSCFKYSIQGSLTPQQRRYLTASHNHASDNTVTTNSCTTTSTAISTISGAVIHHHHHNNNNFGLGGAQLGPSSAKTTTSTATVGSSASGTASSTAGMCPSPAKLKHGDNPCAKMLRLFGGADEDGGQGGGQGGHEGPGGAGGVSRRRRAKLILIPSVVLFLLLAACGLVVYFTVGQRANTRAQELVSPQGELFFDHLRRYFE